MARAKSSATLTKEQYTALAYRWAEERWLLHDRPFVDELVDLNYGVTPDPEQMIDDHAEECGLDDPCGSWSGRSMPARKFSSASHPGRR